ncbi:MarR family transcriptional regulator [Oenococcus oeni]|nr:MarR family transcriptional regulator [Oenococcus oeni]
MIKNNYSFHFCGISLSFLYSKEYNYYCTLDNKSQYIFQGIYFMNNFEKISHELRRYRNYDNTEKVRNYLLEHTVSDGLAELLNSLSISDLDVLSTVIRHHDSRISEIVKHLSFTQGAVSKIVNKLFRLQLIEKYHLADNKKDTYLKGTETGEKIHLLHAEYHREMDQRLLNFSKGFSANELSLIGNFLASINDLREE